MILVTVVGVKSVNLDSMRNVCRWILCVLLELLRMSELFVSSPVCQSVCLLLSVCLLVCLSACLFVCFLRVATCYRYSCRPPVENTIRNGVNHSDRKCNSSLGHRSRSNSEVRFTDFI